VALAVRMLKRPVVAVLIVTSLAGFLRFFHLEHPGEFVFDEVYYPKAACILVGWSDKTCFIDSGDERYWRTNKWDVGSWVHPPLGKWEIAMGVKALGMDPLGWRFTSALAGTLVVLFTAVIAQLLFGNVVWTYVTGGLLAIESLSIVMSRTALLDVHLELWVVIGFLFLVLDRRWMERRQPSSALWDAEVAQVPTTELPEAERALGSPPVYSPVWRPWRFAAGAALGAAASVKWSGAMALFAAIVITYLWEFSRRRRAGATWPAAIGRAIARETFGVVLAFLLVPIGVYMLVWLPWLNHFDWSLTTWWHNQTATWDYHMHGLQWTATDPKTGLQTPTHPYYSRAWQWILMIRPTSFYVKDVGPDIQQILAMGNPAIFWGTLFAIPFCVFAWRRLRDWRAGFIVVAFAGQYLPWFFVSRPTFFFYVLPLTPFMVLGVAYTLMLVSDAKLVSREHGTGEVALNPETGEPAISTAYVYRPFVWIYVLATAIMFWLFWPILTAGQISDLHWRALMWFNRWI
jgi:dolichyl-phosphate-mannose-protein mannosyltransferase